MKFFIFMCDGWGSKFGGINSINYDFVLALGDSQKCKVICLCIGATQDNIQEAKEHSVMLINTTLDDIKKTQTESLNHIISALNSNDIYWVGHDIKTGFWALNYKTCFSKGKLIIFNHMDYNEVYKPRKDSITSVNKKQEQEELFLNADYIFAVGPKLLESAIDRKKKTNGKYVVCEFLPGLSNIEPINEVQNTFCAITFGRIEPQNDIIKQTDLAIRAFTLFAETCETELPTLSLIGLTETQKEEIIKRENRVQSISNEESKSYTNIYTLPYTEDRDKLFTELRSKSVSMMLSLTEGFGLVGLESISAGVPLILSTKSGLYKYLKREGLDLFVTEINIAGTNANNRNDKDVKTLSNILNNIHSKSKSYKRRALCLRKELSYILTWENSVYSFLKDLGVDCLDFQYKELLFNEKGLDQDNLISLLKKNNFKLVNNSRIIEFAADKNYAFETNAFYQVLLEAADKYLWIWGRKNSKLFSIGNSNQWFFKDLSRKIENGFDFRCLFLNPYSDKQVLKTAQKDRIHFKRDLKACIQIAKEKCGDSFESCCKYYDNNRTEEVIIRVDNHVIFSPIISDSNNIPEHFTGKSFYIVSVDSILGKKLLAKFDGTWNSSKLYSELK